MPIMPDPPVSVVGDAEIRDEPAPARSKDDPVLAQQLREKLANATRKNIGDAGQEEKSPRPAPVPQPVQEATEGPEEPPPPPNPRQSFIVEFKIPGFGVQEEEYDLFLPFEPETDGARDRLLILGYDGDRRRKPFAPISRKEDGSELLFSMTVGTDCENPMFFQTVNRLPHTGESGPLGLVLIPMVAILSDKELQIATGQGMGPNLQTPQQLSPFHGARK